MTRENIDTKAIFAAEVAKRKTSDYGREGKAYEIAIRSYIQPKSKRNGKVTRSSAVYGDMRIGNTQKVEIKTGCGELGITDSTDDFDNLLKGMTHVIYCPEVNAGIPMEAQGFVFTRDEFLEMLTGYTGNGALIRTKAYEDGTYRVSFQSFKSEGRPKASGKLADYIWDCCYNQPTVEEWVEA